MKIILKIYLKVLKTFVPQHKKHRAMIFKNY